MLHDLDDILRMRGIVTRPDAFDFIRMTREEAVSFVRAWKELYIPKYNLHYSIRPGLRISSGEENVWLTGMTEDLIELIRNSNDDPITTVAEYNYRMDKILCESGEDHFITQRFAGFMERASYGVLRFLKEKEKEMNTK